MTAIIKQIQKCLAPRKNLQLGFFVLFLFSICGVHVAHAQNTRPCDIYASASPATPCVSAFSTTRALYSTYTGALYQVTRQSDSTAIDIGLLSDGYANAAAQDTFCAATTCTISKIYDQSANHNDLTPAPPGQNGVGAGPNKYDLPASATALPVLVGGHKVYGVYVWPGIGYRNDATKNIATGTQPEGVYMVSSVLEVPTGPQCCFDFGNAETDNNDDNYGAMDAMNLIIDGKGIPAAGLDMENGVPGDWEITPGTQFVTAMGWNDGTSNYEIYWGNAQSGTLMATGSRALPSQYQPMKKQGAIILGIGGDNSNYGPGYFFEGVMTTGTPSDASMNAVQANVVAAGYKGPTTLLDGGTYTFQNEASQLFLANSCDGCSGAPTSGVAIVQNPANGIASQQWTLHAQADGYFTMVSKQSGYCIDDPYGNGTPSRTLPQSQGTSTMLWQIPCNGQTPQNWLFVPQSDGSYTILNQGSTTNNAGNPMVIDVYYGQNTAGLQMWLDTTNSLSPQKWTATLVPYATSLSLSGVPASAVAGVSQSLTVTAQSVTGSASAIFTGTVHFTSTDPNAVLPADYTYTSADAGTHVFPITLKTAGASECITVTDSADSLSNKVCTAVTAAGAATASASAGNNQTTATSTAFATALQVSVADPFGNPVSGATVTFTPVASSGGASGTFSSSTATTSAAGIATASTLTANSTAGSYTVNATVSGIAQAVVFNLTNIVPATFTMTSSPYSLTLTSGQSGAVSLTLTSLGGYVSPSQGITFSCKPLPQQTTCTASATTLTSGGKANVSVAIQTTARTTAALKRETRGIQFPLLALLPMGLLLPFALGRKRRNLSTALLSVLLTGISLGLLSGCGNSTSITTSQTGTPAGMTSVVIYATDGTITQSVPVSLTVQ